jgi:hypothetical protein
MATTFDYESSSPNRESSSRELTMVVRLPPVLSKEHKSIRVLEPPLLVNWGPFAAQDGDRSGPAGATGVRRKPVHFQEQKTIRVQEPPLAVTGKGAETLCTLFKQLAQLVRTAVGLWGHSSGR